HLDLARADPCCRTDRDGQVGEEIPANVSARHRAAELAVVAEREANDARSVAVVWDPRHTIRNREQRVQTQRELTKRVPGGGVPADLGFRRLLARGRGHFDDASPGEAQLQSFDGTAV